MPKNIHWNKIFSWRNFKSCTLFLLIVICFTISIGFVILILGYIFVNGVRYFHFDMLWKPYNSDNPMQGGMGPFIITTLMLLFLTMVISIPISLIIAIFLTEFGKNKIWSQWVRILFNVLNSVPSIIFGMIGVSIFVIFFHLGYNGFSILAGSLTLFMIITPVLVTSMTAAIDAIPKTLIESSYALGSTQWQTVKSIILPSALKNMTGGIIIAISRVIGESAPVYLTIGASVFMPSGFLSQGRSLVTCIYILFTEGKGADAEHFIYCLVFVVIFLILIINMLTKFVIWFLGRRENSNNKKVSLGSKIKQTSSIKAIKAQINNIRNKSRTEVA